MLRFSLARLVGIVVLLLATLFLVMRLGDRNWMAAGLMLLVLLGGLWLAFWGDHRLRAAQVQAEAHRRQEGEAFQDAELRVGLRWFKWCLLTCILAGLLALMWGALLPHLWSSGRWGQAAFAGLIGALFALCLPALLSLGLRSLNGESLLQVGPLGVQVLSWPLLRWSQLHGVDLQETEIKGRKQWRVFLATDGAYQRYLPGRWRLLLWDWPVARCLRKGHLIEVPLGFLRQNPHRLVQALRFIGMRQGAPLVTGWRHSQAIEQARESQRLQREADEASRVVDLTLAELQRLGTGQTSDFARLAALDSRMAADLERMRSKSDAHFSGLMAEGNALKRRARSAVRGVWIGLGLVLIWVVVSVVLALTR